ncbi:MAG: hypothetical protein CBC12_07275 [Candidatus Puniceispirillum sp. TMED52]|nr:MAG: hypothetical protein CBC12_07275 [Candidatus Puniceispirillum sp. TMED52]
MSLSYTDLVTSLGSGGIVRGDVYPNAQLKLDMLDGSVEQLQLFPTQVASVMDRFVDNGVDVSLVPSTGNLIGLVLQSLPTLLLVGLLAFMVVRQTAMASMMPNRMLRDETVLSLGERVNTTFADVAGLTSAKEELREVVDYLQNPDRFLSSGAKAHQN